MEFIVEPLRLSLIEFLGQLLKKLTVLFFLKKSKEFRNLRIQSNRTSFIDCSYIVKESNLGQV